MRTRTRPETEGGGGGEKTRKPKKRDLHDAPLGVPETHVTMSRGGVTYFLFWLVRKITCNFSKLHRSPENYIILVTRVQKILGLSSLYL